MPKGDAMNETVGTIEIRVECEICGNVVPIEETTMDFLNRMICKKCAESIWRTKNEPY